MACEEAGEEKICGCICEGVMSMPAKLKLAFGISCGGLKTFAVGSTELRCERGVTLGRFCSALLLGEVDVYGDCVSPPPGVDTEPFSCAGFFLFRRDPVSLSAFSRTSLAIRSNSAQTLSIRRMELFSSSVQSAERKLTT